jgi:CpeT protein
MNKSVLPYIFFMILFFGCAASKSKVSVAASDAELDQLAALMEGDYSSELQSQRDTNYYHISLVMTPIWTNRTDGKWLYVEQAMATKLDKPYRQRVYHLQHPSNNTFTSDIYTIKDALTFAGLKEDKSKRENLTFDQIDLKEGCTVTLVHRDTIYDGGTDRDKCPSDLRGAKYATTKIVLRAGELVSWDQGFDPSGTQVWGATEGGYVFVKK